jgi:large subunit ribosomal protein L22
MVEAQATARGVRTSAQKAGLVCDLIRGKSVNQALATLQFTRKIIARELAKVLRSAVANLQQKEGFSGDVDTLFVAACYAGQGPSMKRVRPAPMGRAFRVVKRTAHLTVRVAERSSEPAAPTAEAAAQAQSSPAPEAAGKATGRGARKGAQAKKSATSKGGGRAKAGARGKTGRNTRKKSR